jgi:hypothetical protein
MDMPLEISIEMMGKPLIIWTEILLTEILPYTVMYYITKGKERRLPRSTEIITIKC